MERCVERRELIQVEIEQDILLQYPASKRQLTSAVPVRRFILQYLSPKKISLKQLTFLGTLKAKEVE